MPRPIGRHRSFGTSSPNTFRHTKHISHGSNFWPGEKSGAVASALVLWGDAQNVRKRPYAGEDTDALARPRLGRHSHGSRGGAKTACFSALLSIGKNPRSRSYRVSVLSRRQFCRGQKSRSER